MMYKLKMIWAIIRGRPVMYKVAVWGKVEIRGVENMEVLKVDNAFLNGTGD